MLAQSPQPVHANRMLKKAREGGLRNWPDSDRFFGNKQNFKQDVIAKNGPGAALRQPRVRRIRGGFGGESWGCGGGGLGVTPEMVVCGEVKRPSSQECPKNETQTAHRKTWSQDSVANAKRFTPLTLHSYWRCFTRSSTIKAEHFHFFLFLFWRNIYTAAD